VHPDPCCGHSECEMGSTTAPSREEGAKPQDQGSRVKKKGDYVGQQAASE
jgi:hypothetical protein